VPLAVLFTVLTVAFAGIAVGSASAGRWVIAAAAAVLAAWTATFAWQALRRTRS
jgi:TRAP-type mannitol/chloroaromatic compound transport system permease large subunit